MRILKHILTWLLIIVLLAGAASLFLWVHERWSRHRVLEAVIERLSAESRIAEVLVTQSRFVETTKKIETTIKFLEYDAKGEPLAPKFFTFQGNIIQFQTLVIRFEDELVRAGHKLKGKSAYLFLRVFLLDGDQTEVYELSLVSEIPQGYKVSGVASEFEQELWEEFWTYALDPAKRTLHGVKNAQIEAPGSMFLPGTIYTLRIEHDGGVRIDTEPIPKILRDELRGVEGEKADVQG